VSDVHATDSPAGRNHSIDASPLLGGFETSRPPLQENDSDPAAILTWVPGVFAYTFGSAGWPDGVAPYGANPNRVPLRMDGLSMNDLLTGRPRYDLAPAALVRSLNMDPSTGIDLVSDSLSQPAPLTIVRYQSAGDAMQAVQSVHVQNRVFMAPDSTTRKFQALFGYSGAGARGEYDGSRLKRAREVTIRLRYETPRWSVEFLDMARRRSVGAHTGVIPLSGASYESIYQRLGATVGDSEARRRTIRNDLVLSGTTRIAGNQALSKIYWTVQTLDFSGESFNLKGVAERMGVDLSVSRMIRRSHADVRLRGFSDRFTGGNVYEPKPDARSFLSMVARVQGNGAGFGYRVELGPEKEDTRSWFHMSGLIQKQAGRFLATGQFLATGLPLANHEVTGFGAAVFPLPEAADPSLSRGSLGLTWQSSWLSLRAQAWRARYTDPVQAVYDEVDGAIAVQVLSGSADAQGLSIEIGFRDLADRGVYALLNPVFSNRSTESETVVARSWRRSTPQTWSSARLGLRAHLFEDDLDLDTYVRARYWGTMDGLRLHPATGLLALPSATSQSLESNWLIDVVAEAGVRGATIFLSYENVFSGTTTQVGNLIVPDYPLPRQRTRFGVYWPIMN